MLHGIDGVSACKPMVVVPPGAPLLLVYLWYAAGSKRHKGVFFMNNR